MEEDPYEMKWDSLVYSNGSVYQGTSQAGKSHGRGCLLFPHGDRYEGDFYQGAPHGFGVYHWPDGSSFHGQLRNGQPNGCGRKLYSNKEREEGEFLEEAFVGDLMSCDAAESEAAAMAADNSAHDAQTLIIKPLEEQVKKALSMTGVKLTKKPLGHEMTIQKLGSITVSTSQGGLFARQTNRTSDFRNSHLDEGALLQRVGKWVQTRFAHKQ
mmetsp:Transcript_7471/g.12871  ORF Transcript_7471/g.12871 Transcript_7471/m.12871 type:complete len:212 (+) Transcript_7471:166-801(+)|eukprot:CAMPEP_0198208620 /NCGR_PEP_ID=MMETSP1445-20131203/11959_1 /TAXON_ID=36898 /ORGANISM="Pyramimonas sp., Strain CCMP2087" /LENGTH=211 /DNA_ID=CAMNT_0043882081 /DNA_START=153 /DNA_END=788 /DNA_ORIENTATION=+